MNARRLSLWILLLVGCTLAPGESGKGPGAENECKPKGPNSYASHYLVFGTKDASGTPRLLALDLNRTQCEDGQVAFEYKLFVAKGGNWSLPVYETWETSPAPDARRFPARGGLTPSITEDGHLRRVTADLANRTLEVAPQHPEFPFPTGDTRSATRTGHPQFTVRWNGTTYRGPGVYEWIRPVSAPQNPEATAEEKRKLDDASFGLYDWIVLYDEKGRLWQISQGTLTGDFAYQQATEALPAETRDVLVRWTATEKDEKANLHSPVAWLVDVPAWKMRLKLKKQGEHRGHGPLQDNGTRPIYVQATARGKGLIRGKEHQFFGMVEHIRD